MEVINSNTQNIRTSLKDILAFIGEDPNREGLFDTPDRIIKSYSELFKGYSQDPKEILSKYFIDGACKEMVILKNFEFFSTCEHHFLPFYGSISIAYIPNGKVIGLSKLARLADCFSRRLQIQEKMTTQIADSLFEILEPLGVMVVCEAVHLCMVSRGVQKKDGKMVTSAIRGNFEKQEVRQEFLNLLK